MADSKKKRQIKAMMHPDILGAGAKKRELLPCSEKPAVVMREFYHGTLHGSSGMIVPKSRPDIAKAIAMSEKRACERRK